jgi:hypothetical protein
VPLLIDIKGCVIRRASQVSQVLGLTVIPNNGVSIEVFAVTGRARSLACVVDGDGQRVNVACEWFEFVDVAPGHMPEDRPAFGLCLRIA